MSFENFSFILPKSDDDISGIFHQYDNINVLAFASYEHSNTQISHQKQTFVKWCKAM